MSLKERGQGRGGKKHNRMHAAQRWKKRQDCRDQPASWNLFDVSVEISVIIKFFKFLCVLEVRGDKIKSSIN